jgi:hypothetical protein
MAGGIRNAIEKLSVQDAKSAVLPNNDNRQTEKSTTSIITDQINSSTDQPTNDKTAIPSSLYFILHLLLAKSNARNREANNDIK